VRVILPLSIFRVIDSLTVQIGELCLGFFCAVGWQFVGWFDLEYTLQLLREEQLYRTPADVKHCKCKVSTWKQMVSLVALQRQM